MNNALYNETGIEYLDLPSSVKAVSPWGGVSASYKFASTLDIIDMVKKEIGFVPVHASQSRTRIEGKGAYTKHMLRFRALNSAPVLGGLHWEIVVVNSHDKASSLSASLGCYRLVCSNGLVMGGDMFTTGRLHHTGRGLNGFMASIQRILSMQENAANTVASMQNTIVSQEGLKLFAKQAVALKYPKLGYEENDIMAGRVLQPRRYQDMKSDLFSAYNVIQENLLAKGLHGLRGRRVRAVTSIDANMSINSGLWSLASQLAA